MCCLVTELQQQPAHTLSDNEQAKGAQITVLSVPFGAVRVRESEGARLPAKRRPPLCKAKSSCLVCRSAAADSVRMQQQQQQHPSIGGEVEAERAKAAALS